MLFVSEGIEDSAGIKSVDDFLADDDHRNTSPLVFFKQSLAFFRPFDIVLGVFDFSEV